MAQAFEGAQPQVVRGKPKYKPQLTSNTHNQGFYDQEDTDKREALNIMHDKRVFRGNTHNMNLIQSNLTAQQKDELRIKEEQEQKKIEMIKTQLLQYKKQKHKPSPYDLRPGPPARIDVDLTYFLTENNVQKPVEIEVKTQTDPFLPRPETPQYVPKKTGINKETQIGDYDLFDYDREVQPILNVLLTKTVEQALLEVEEETELEEIRKFKTEYEQRQVSLRVSFEEEVKREIQRIKQKNKALKNAQAKRDRQIKTMHRLQCLNLSKQFLRGCYKGTLNHLAENSFWRDSFSDQLNISYKLYLTNRTHIESESHSVSETFIDNLVKDQVNQIVEQKQALKKIMTAKASAREATRFIESESQRVVHFVFNPMSSCKITPFTRKFKLLMEGELEDFERDEHEKFENYLKNYIDETLEENEPYPIVFEKNEFYDLELNAIKHIAFSVADSPFQKTDPEKYYPEAIVVNSQGEILSQLGGNISSEKQSNIFPSLKYRTGFRDEKLRINDDRKIEMILDEFQEPGIQIIFFVKSFDLRKIKDVPENAFKEAWFRLQNETTGQTIDYTKISNIEIPEDYDEDGLVQEDDEEANEVLSAGGSKQRNELIFIAGRVYREDINIKTKQEHKQPKWIYEKWNKTTTTRNFPNIYQTLADLTRSSVEEMQFYDEQIKEAQEKLETAAEERRQAALAAAAKRKAAVKKGAKKEDPLPEPTQVPETKLPVRKLNQEEEIEAQDLDLYLPAQFGQAIHSKFCRRFTFGPVWFKDLDQYLDPIEAHELVLESLVSTSSVGEPDNNIFIHGFRVTVKDRTLKRGTTLLKHARFLVNLEVTPMYPAHPEFITEEEDQVQELEEDQ